MPKRTAKIPIFPANKGLERSSIPGTAAKTSLYDCDNVIFTVNGSRRKRWGLSPYYRNGFSTLITQDMRGMIDFWRNVSGVQTQKVVLYAGGELWADSNDGRFTQITGTTALNDDDQVTFDVFIGILIAAFENAVPQYWDMAAATFVNLDTKRAAEGKVVTIPSASICRVHGGRLWLSGVKTAPHRLYYSAPDLPWSFDLGDTGGFMDANTGDSDPIGITSIFPSFHDDLYVAKRRSLYRVKTLTSGDLASQMFSLEPVYKGIGCIAHNSVVATPNDIIWCSERGIHSLNATDKYGDVEQSFLSYPIHDIYQNEVNFAMSKNMWAVYSPEMNSYLLAYTKRGRRANTEVLGYNVVEGSWFRWKDFDCAALAQFVDNRFKTQTLVATESLNVGQLSESTATDFGTTSYSMFFQTPLMYPFNDPTIECNFKKLFVYFKPQPAGVITVGYQIDEGPAVFVNIDQTLESFSGFSAGSEGALIGTAIIGKSIIGDVGTAGSTTVIGGGTIKKMVVPLQGTGNTLRLYFSQTPASATVGEFCDIFGYVIEVEPAGDADVTVVS